MNEILENCTGFEWDEGNSQKNFIGHQVSDGECEQVFFNVPLIVHEDVKHAIIEKRWFLLGKTSSGRLLFLVFTIRNQLIRVISARDMNKKERQIYYGKVKENTGF
jgi:uncharacterized DUF497 family protein